MRLVPFILCFVLFACSRTEVEVEIESINWEARQLSTIIDSTYTEGQSYLSIYSQIYGQNEHRLHDLTVTVGIRNTSETDSVFISRATYYNTQGETVKRYINGNIYIKPMETVEIVIDQKQNLGGTGGNFIFDWNIKSGAPTPLFEAVMISTSGQQGLSFTTQGVRTK